MIALALAAAVGLMPAAAAGGGKKQKVQGTVAAAGRHPDGCYTGLHRRLQAFLGENSQGIVGYDFDVSKGTWNKPFVMKLTEGTGTVDLDITYYLGERTTVDDFVEQTNDPVPPASVSFEDRAEGGEKGTVPKGSVYAIVCIYESENGVGGNASFSYLAGKGVR
jgi:hypothetical protein